MQDEKNEKEKLEVRMQEMEMEMRHEKEKQSRETGELNARNKEMETRLEWGGAAGPGYSRTHLYLFKNGSQLPESFWYFRSTDNSTIEVVVYRILVSNLNIY